MDSVQPSTIPYFYGRITRDEAEAILKSRGSKDGLYLLRESISPFGNYAISVVLKDKIHHYSVEQQPDGSYMISDGTKFPGPVELVQHHQTKRAGMLVTLNIPCNRCIHQKPIAFRGMTYDKLEDLLKAKTRKIKVQAGSHPSSHFPLEDASSGGGPSSNMAVTTPPKHTAIWVKNYLEGKEADGTVSEMPQPAQSLGMNNIEATWGHVATEKVWQEPNTLDEPWKGASMNKAFGPMKQHLMLMVAKDLVSSQPWYHMKISREQAEERLEEDGHVDGKFLVRLRDDKKSYALSVSHKMMPKHYLLDYNKMGKFAIDKGPQFDCLMMMIDHYHNKADGLLCKLSEPCCRPGYNHEKFLDYVMNSQETTKLVNGMPCCPMPPSHKSSANSFAAAVANSKPSIPLNKPPSPPTFLNTSISKRKLPALPPEAMAKDAGGWTEKQESFSYGVNRFQESMNSFDSEKLESDYQLVPRNMETFNIDRDQLELQEDLGEGQFGSVRLGMCKIYKSEVPVAVKCLKNDTLHSDKESELMKEARVMQSLDHKHITRMIGVCWSENVMLVLELALLGPLNKYLMHNRELPPWNIVKLMWQVAMGMEYLESKKFVHRDLAARNVLLVTEHFAKISDFGMSKALNMGSNYYQAETVGRWPLKWYAPECIYYWKFDSKSDVWSFGVTLWEAISYGEKPYKGLKGHHLLQFVDNGNRLSQPEHCSNSLYEIMLECWNYDKKGRPSFTELVMKMEIAYNTLKNQQ